MTPVLLHGQDYIDLKLVTLPEVASGFGGTEKQSLRKSRENDYMLSSKQD